MKKVIFKEYRQYGALTCGVFMIICGLILTYVEVMFAPTITNVRKIIYAISLPCMFYAMGILLSTYCYVYPKTGIKEIIINDSNILIIAYNEEKKEYTLNLPISEILSSRVNISYNKDYNEFPSRNDRMDILIDFNIECKENNYQITFHTEDYHKVKQIFSVAKYFPNFSYKVDTNSQECQENILNLAKKGKNLSLKQHFSTYFANPQVPAWQKIFVKILFVIMIFYSCFLIFAIISIIKDLLN